MDAIREAVNRFVVPLSFAPTTASLQEGLRLTFSVGPTPGAQDDGHLVVNPTCSLQAMAPVVLGKGLQAWWVARAARGIPLRAAAEACVANEQLHLFVPHKGMLEGRSCRPWGPSSLSLPLLKVRPVPVCKRCHHTTYMLGNVSRQGVHAPNVFAGTVNLGTELRETSQ